MPTTFALNARTDADRQRAEAEGLVEFMLTDLRTTLKGVGRLDAMTAVNERALRYYGNRDLDSLPPESLERRARIFHAMGEDDESRGDHAAALAKFMEARRTTAALLAAAPNDPNRIFDHAQSEFWIGQVAYARMQYKDAKTGFKAYKALVDRLVSISPNNPKYQREAGYADGNLCVIALKAPKDPVSALILCRAALNHMEAAARFSKMSGTVIADLANRHGWLAGAYSANGNNREALTHRLIQERMLEELMGVDSKNMDLKTRWIGVQRILAWIEATSGQQQDALARLRRAANVSDQLVAFDPSNKSWAAQRARITSDFAEVAGLQTKRTLR